MRRTEYDVVIIGGGLVGCSLAYALKNSGLSIALIEAHGAPQKKSSDQFNTRAISLSTASKRIFTGMGLWPDIEALTTPIKEIHVSERGRFAASRFMSKEVNEVGIGYVIEAHAIGLTIYQHLQECSNLTIWHHCHLESLEINDNDALVVLTEHDQTKHVTAKLVIGCDGAQSKTRSCMQLPFETRNFDQTAIISTIALQQAHNHIAYERFTIDGTIAFLPLSDQRAALVWSAPNKIAKKLLAYTDTEFLTELQSSFGYRAGCFNAIGKRISYPLNATRTEKIFADRVVLIGNAAHALHPIAGQGFNLGLRDAAVLAELICHADPSHIADENVLNRYVQLRKDDHKNIAFLCEFLPTIYHSSFLPSAIFRNACLLSFDLCPEWKLLFMRHLMGIKGWQSNLACGVPLG